MKRLLAYLFIVLGLGLTFSVNANSRSLIAICEITLDESLMDSMKLSLKPYDSLSIFKKSPNFKNGKCNRFAKVGDELGDKLSKNYIDRGKAIIWKNELNKIAPYNAYIYQISKKGEINKIYFSEIIKKVTTTKDLSIENPFCIVKNLNTENFISVPITYIREMYIRYKWDVRFFSNKPASWKSLISSKKFSDIAQICELKIFSSEHPNRYRELKIFYSNTGGTSGSGLIHSNKLAKIVGKKLFSKIDNNQKTKIAKAKEESQTQEVDKNNKYKYNLKKNKTIPFLKISLNENINDYNLKFSDKNVRKLDDRNVYFIFKRKFNSSKNIFDNNYLKFSSIDLNNTVPYSAIMIITDKKNNISSIKGTIYYKNFKNNSFIKSETKNCEKFRKPFISRELKLSDDEISNNFTSAYIYTEYKKNNIYGYDDVLRKSSKGDFKSSFAISCAYRINPEKKKVTSSITVSITDAYVQLESWKKNKGFLISKFTGDDLLNLTKNKDNKFTSYYEYLNYDYGFVSSEKTKVAKTTQEEFKPETGDIDNDAPVIEIAEAITVDSQAYTLKGKVKDKSQVYLTIDGRQVDVKKGKFKLDRFNIDPDVAENINIVAIDKWNNRTEKTIKITIDLQSTDIAKVYEQLKPNNVKVRTDKNKIAIIIGIEKYENLTNLDAKYANRDAKAFRTYATRALGIKPSNIKVLIDDKANRGNTLEAFKIWLPKIAGKGGKDIHIFFAGHGLTSENGKDLYILPQDGNAKLLDDTAITRVELITLIQKVKPKSVTMFFDTCYSGQTRDEKMLVASLLRPIQIISEEQDTPDNFTIFSASNYDQVSGGIEEAQHGMFSYYLMKGLEGKADKNGDRKITNGELIAYLKDNVSKEAFAQNRQQDPMLVGDPDKILIKF